ncbi:uncharacterized protein LOC9300798 isoform X2 [Arabidopsis lyrata subsp. lyrata]|uniref:uncharacterized protein LOC9300798 isoform X2 n=1 Tax=Arabidopsis lyrata subsp. lyrata TaxID=81972 RepID=UPI000A29DC48|nr:uncharacterized protein LOC9300798 isoform X2 [Arabidopsis lyrata subsp. lyrata]|eukprot:XP_020883449.1 uncharacterized protein LOC9300798 isoform X2 [Arabidopsis lyrata subsp. lyrata]
MSTAEADYVKAKTSVWWDIENCEVPRGWDAHVIAQNVSSALLKMNYCGPVSISAYGDTNLIPLHHQQALSSTGVALNHIPAGVKDASDKKILVDMLLWAIDNPAPANFLLISGDRDFSNALHQLRMRRYNILLAQPPRASVPLVAAAKDVWLWTTLASGGPPLTSSESSLLFCNGRIHVSNKEVLKHPVSEQAQPSQPPGSTSKAGDTMDHKTRGLPQETIKNMPQNGRGATGESSLLVNNGHGHVPNYEVSKYPVSEPAKSSKPTDSTSDSGDTKDHKTRENHFPRGSPQETRKNMFQNGRGATGEPNTTCRICNVVCDSFEKFTAHLSDIRHISQAAFVGSRRVPASVSAKPIQEAVLVEPLLCKVCQISFTNKDAYKSHTYGKRHRKNLELQSGKSKNILVGPAEPSKEVLEKHKKNKKVLIEGRAKTNADFACRLCNVVCQSQIVFDSHLRGQKHANMLSQSEAPFDSNKLQEKCVGEKDQPGETFAEPQLQSQKAHENTKCFEKHVSMANESEVLVDSKKLQEQAVEEKDQPSEISAQPKVIAKHVCRLCNVVCHSPIVFDSHLRGQKHAAKLNESKALIDSKKLQEKGVGEKDQPRETVVEPQFQPQNAQENNICYGKHVVMVNQSEELIYARELEEKDVREAQPKETIAEPQSQSQNTQEHTKFFEKQNEELRKICGTSESSVKELFPSTKHRVETVNKQIPNGEFLFGDIISDFEVDRGAREFSGAIVKPVKLSKGATVHSMEVKNKKKEVTVRQAIPAASKLCHLCVVICDSRGLSTVVCDSKAHWPNQKHTTAAFGAGDVAQSSVSTKPMKEPEGLQPVWCQICQISCNSKVVYASHTYGKKHRQNMELQSAKNENMAKGPAKLSKDYGEKTKKVPCKNETTFDSQLKSQNHSAMIKEPAEEAFVNSRRTPQEFNQEKPREALEQFIVDSRTTREETDQEKEITEEHTLVKMDDVGFRGALEDKVELKERQAVSENLVHRVFTEQNRESRIPNEPRGYLDVIPERVELPPNVNVAKNLEDEPEHKPEPKAQEPKNKSAGRKDHPGEAAKREENKGQADNFWTRLWGKKV